MRLPLKVSLISKVEVKWFGTFFYYLATMTTYYFRKQEDALKKAKQAGKVPNTEINGITLANGRKGFEIYRKGNLVERYLVVKPKQLL